MVSRQYFFAESYGHCLQCAAGSMQERYSVRLCLSDCLSHLVLQPQHAAPDQLLCAGPAISTGSGGRPTVAAPQHGVQQQMRAVSRSELTQEAKHRFVVLVSVSVLTVLSYQSCSWSCPVCLGPIIRAGKILGYLKENILVFKCRSYLRNPYRGVVTALKPVRAEQVRRPE